MENILTMRWSNDFIRHLPYNETWDRWTDRRTDRRTDRHGFGILIWKHVGTQKISTQNSKLVVSRRSLYASPEVGDA